MLLTSDKNIRYQQNLSGRKIAILVLGNQQWPDAKLHLERVLEAVNSATSGSFLDISRQIVRCLMPCILCLQRPLTYPANHSEEFERITFWNALNCTANLSSSPKHRSSNSHRTRSPTLLSAFYTRPWFAEVFWWKLFTNGFGGRQDNIMTP